jgi:hypothetical protein
MQNDIAKLKCNECGKQVEYGGDVITMEKCVSGPRGIVPLGETLIFCCEECVGNYYGASDISELTKMPPRIP